MQARHQTRDSTSLSFWVQYLSEARSRSAIDFIMDAGTASSPTGGGATGFV